MGELLDIINSLINEVYMKFTLLLLAFFSLSAHAQFMNSLCQKKVRNIEYHLPFITDGENLWSEAGTLLFKNEERYLSMAHVADSFFFLSQSELIKKDSSGAIVARFDLPSLSVLSWGKRLLNFGDIIYVLHEDGVSAFDQIKNEFLWIHSVGDLAGGVMVHGAIMNGELLVLLANGYEGAFAGAVTIDFKGERKKVQKWDLWRSGFIDHSATIRWTGDKLLINNSGWMQYVDAKQFRGSKGLRVKLAPSYVMDSQNNRRHLDMVGDFFLTDLENGKTEFTGCGKYTYEDQGELKQGSDLYSFTF